MQRSEVARFVASWIEGWNAREVERVLAHYDERAVFHSPKAVAIVGRGRIEGKAALREYWNAALAKLSTLRFTLEHFAWDETRAELFIVYLAELNQQRTRACERMRFQGAHVIDGEGLYGAPL